jgi:hypothetical protein
MPKSETELILKITYEFMDFALGEIEWVVNTVKQFEKAGID